MAVKYEKVEAIRCTACGSLHLAEDETYFAVVGNILIGKQGGIIGNNLSEKKHMVTGVTAYCRKPECFENFVDAVKSEVLSYSEV